MNTISVLTLGCSTLLAIAVILVNSVDCKAVALSKASHPLGELQPLVHPDHTGQHQDQHHSISKRNTWWSKKSMDGWNRRSPMEDIHKIALERRSGSRDVCGRIKEAFDCYTSQCVPDFVWCSQAAISDADYLQCQLEHKKCTNRCTLGEGTMRRNNNNNNEDEVAQYEEFIL